MKIRGRVPVLKDKPVRVVEGAPLTVRRTGMPDGLSFTPGPERVKVGTIDSAETVDGWMVFEATVDEDHAALFEMGQLRVSLADDQTPVIEQTPAVEG